MVHSADLRGISIGNQEGRDILYDLGATSDDGMGADAAELVDSAESPDHRVIAHHNVACQGAVVGENHMITDDAVMGDVGVGEEISITADTGHASRGGGAVNGREFAKSVVGPDLQMSRFGLVFEILRTLTDRAERVKLVAVADHRWAGNHHMTMESASLAERHVGPDDAVGTDERCLADVGRRINDRRGMNPGHGVILGLICRRYRRAGCPRRPPRHSQGTCRWPCRGSCGP